MVFWNPKFISSTIKKHQRCEIFVEKELHIGKAAQSEVNVGIGPSMRRNAGCRKRKKPYFRVASKMNGNHEF